MSVPTIVCGLLAASRDECRCPGPPAGGVEHSFRYCDVGYAALDSHKIGESIAARFSSGQTTRTAAVMGNTGHLHEHYGNLVTYLRMIGLVPPSSAPHR